MKQLYAILCLCGTLLFISSAAQETVPVNLPDYDRPKLFQLLPDTILVEPGTLTSLLNKQEGNIVSSQLASGGSFIFEGRVASVTNKYDNSIQTVVILSTNYEGASLIFSRVILENGIVLYRGRIISFRHGDMFELSKKEENFILIKKDFYAVVNE